MSGLIFDPLDAPTGDTFAFVMPRFSGKCVCCNADAQGATLHYDTYAVRVDGRRVSSPPVPMPVCAACTPHALSPTGTSTRMVALLLLGGMLMAFGVIMLAKDSSSDDVGFAYAVLGAGALSAAVGGFWMALQSSKEKREKPAGHWPGLTFAIAPGMTVLHSDNEALIDALVRLNPNARRPPPAG